MNHKKPFNSYPEKYQYDSWNLIEKMVDSFERAKHMRNINIMVKGNFYAFMNRLLDFRYSIEEQTYVARKPRR